MTLLSTLQFLIIHPVILRRAYLFVSKLGILSIWNMELKRKPCAIAGPCIIMCRILRIIL